MKKRLLFACASLVLFFASLKSEAQLQSGNILVGGDIANFDLGLDEGGNFSFVINPKAAWFIADYTAIGAYLTFGLSTAKDAGTSINYGVGALGRYYLGERTSDLLHKSKFFLEGNVGIEGDNPSTGDNTNGLGLGVGPGWSFFVTQNVALEALFKYNLIIGFGSAVTSNNLNLNVGFQIFLPTSKVKAISKDIQSQ
jgi:opacity protein-like surface antigen